ncbi:hypothetical protein D3C73_1031290 [compost metagenome]
MGSDFQHFLHGPFTDQPLLVVFIRYDDRQAATHKIERQLVNLAETPQCFNTRFATPKADHRLIHQVFHPALVEAVQPGQMQHFIVSDAADVQVVFEDDAILGQGAGFVGAEYVHRAKILDGIQTFDHHFTP